MKRSKQTRLLSVGVLLAVLLAAACGSSNKDDTSKNNSSSSSGTSAAASGTATEARTQAAAGAYTAESKDKQTLVVNLGATPDFLDPHKSQFEQDIAIERLLFRGLYFADEKGNPTPAVAKAMPELSSDAKTLKITLKDNQKWSDGSPLTAKDFEYSLKRTFNPKLASPYASFAYNIVGSEEYNTAFGTKAAPKTPSDAELNALRDAVGVKALDDKTLQITLKEPQPTMPVILGLWNAYPVKQSVVEAGGATPDSTAWTDASKLIGNGPFVLKEFKPKDRITLEANPNYTIAEKPKLNRLDIRLIEDEEVAFNAFQTGELDQVSVPPSKVPVVDGDPALKKLNLRSPQSTTRGIEFNHTVKPLDNQKVRLAISEAVDRDAFVKVVYAGVALPTTCWLPPGEPGYDPADCTAQKFDLAKAKKDLADAGYPNGQGFPELSIVYTNSPANKTNAEFIQKQLKDNLGINIKIDLVDAKTRSSRYSNGQFELFFGGWNEDYHDPENWLPELFSTNGGNNQDKYSNATFDNLMKQAKFEQNNEKRIALYKQAHKLLVDDVARVNLTNSVRNWLVKSKVKNVSGNSNDSGWLGQFGVEKVEIAKE